MIFMHNSVKINPITDLTGISVPKLCMDDPKHEYYLRNSGSNSCSLIINKDFCGSEGNWHTSIF